MLSLLLYGGVFLLGYGACHALNLAARRELVGNLNFGGLAIVAIFALVHASLLVARMPRGLSPETQGEILGQLVAGPTLLVIFVVLGNQWWRRRQKRTSTGD
jgi:hypothetical protein